MNKRRAALFALAHFAIWGLAFGFSFSRTMARFDTGDSSGLFDAVLGASADVLSVPIVFFVSELGSDRTVFLLALLANSLLWGLAVEYAYQRLRRSKQRRT